MHDDKILIAVAVKIFGICSQMQGVFTVDRLRQFGLARF